MALSLKTLQRIKETRHKMHLHGNAQTVLDNVGRRPSTRPFMSLFERTAILSTRAAALANNAPTTLDIEPSKLPTSAIRIAEMEMEAGVIPLLLTRTFPSGSKELVRLGSLTGKPTRHDQTFSVALTAREYRHALKNPHCLTSYCTADRVTTYTGKVADTPQFVYRRKFTSDEWVNEADPTLADPFTPTAVSVTMEDLVESLPVDPERLRWSARGQRTATHLHLGQLKLFLSTLQFLQLYAPKDRVFHIVYPGSAHGHNIPLLASLFPNARWHLIDPGDYDERLLNDETGTFDVVNSLFTDELCRKYAEQLEGEHTLLISDIRIKNDDDSIRRDNALQMSWVDILRPTHAQLKFRLPFDRTNYEYLDGRIYLQMFAPVASTECRLVVTPPATGPLVTVPYDVKRHEGVMYYFNRRVRPADHGAFRGKVDRTYLDDAYDSVAMIQLLRVYVASNGGSVSEVIDRIVDDKKGVSGVGIRLRKSYRDVRAALVDAGDDRSVKPYTGDAKK